MTAMGIFPGTTRFALALLLVLGAVAPAATDVFYRSDIDRALRGYINQETQKHDGNFEVTDPKTGKTEKLTLKKIHADKVARLRDGRSVVSAEFRDPKGYGVGVDFVVRGDGKGGIAKVDRVLLKK